MSVAQYESQGWQLDVNVQWCHFANDIKSVALTLSADCAALSRIRIRFFTIRLCYGVDAVRETWSCVPFTYVCVAFTIAKLMVDDMCD